MEGVHRVYIDVMVGGRFYRQLPYSVIGGKVALETLQKYVCEKLPTLKNKAYAINFSSNRIIE